MINQNNMNSMMMMSGMMNMMANMNQLQNMMMGMIKNANTNTNINNDNDNDKRIEKKNEEKDEAQLSIIFQKNKDKYNIDFKISIPCRYDDLVNDVLDRYCFKINEKKEDLLFLFASKDLQKVFGNQTVQKAGLTSTSIVLVIDARLMKGGKI